MEHVIEEAKSGRASCRGCRKKIGKGEQRFGEQYEGDFGSGVRWYHVKCAASKVPALLKETLASYEGEITGRAEIDELIAKGASKKAKGDRAFPYAEPAPSGRSKCMACEEKIEKGAWRVAIEREIDTGSMVTRGAGYLHVPCAPDHVDDLDWSAVEANSQLEDQDLAGLREARSAD